jgi:hypothetical protein
MAVSITLEITQNSQNIANNSSNVTVSARVHWTNGSWNATGECDGNIVIDGTKYKFYGLIFNPNATQSGSTIVMTRTVDIAHNADGTKTLACSTEFYTGLSPSIISNSASLVLTAISRASQPSLVTWPETTNNVGDFGEEFSIHMNRESSNFTHTVRYEYGSRTGTIATGVTTGTTWAVPLSFMNDIPNATSASGRIYVDTYNGSTKIGTKYTGFTVTVPASVKPGVSVTLEDVDGYDDTYGKPVQNLSRIKVKITATAAYGSPIDSYSTTVKNSQYPGAEFTTAVLNSAGDYPVTVTVKDKRGRTNTWSYTMNVLAYTPPAVSSITARRCNKDGTANDRGDFVEVTFSAVVSPLNNKNTSVYVLHYKKTSETNWHSLAIDANGKTPQQDLAGKYTVDNAAYIFKADGNSSYVVAAVVADRFGNQGSKSTSASTAFTLMNFHESGNALRFGGVADKETTFQNDLTFVQTGNSYCFSSIGAASTDGYILMARITVTATNSDTPITFVFSRRKAVAPMTVHVLFKSTADTDPGLASIRYEGDNYDAFLTSPSESVWDLYVKKVSNSDTITLNDWHTSYRQMNRIAVNFVGTIVSTVPAGRFGYYRATPAVLPSIIDCLLPVGMIIQLYSHADPNDMYPGTTWERIQNAFLWAVDDKGTIGQTGGAETVTLKVEEIPSHTHGSVYSGNVSGTKTHAWLASGGTAMAYGTVAAGGGQAHNNMPPYVQVSVWRRTA